MAKKQMKERPAVGKRLKKEVKRVVRKHGATVAMGLLTGIILDLTEKAAR